ncbi:hypothetical protein PO909_022630 [Leuciscus waleckii]
MLCHCKVACHDNTLSLMFGCKYRYQDEDSPPLEHNFPRLTNEVRAPELVHVSEKNLSEIENVHGYVSHSHISPLKILLSASFGFIISSGLCHVKVYSHIFYCHLSDYHLQMKCD